MAVNRHRRKNGTVSYRVSVYDPRTRQTVWAGTFDSKDSARQAELDAERELRSRTRINRPKDPTVKEFVDTWL